MDRPSISISIPGFSEPLVIRQIVSDYTGTLSCGGKLISGAAERLRKLKELVEIHVLSADSFGTALGELAVIPVAPKILEPDQRHDIAKERRVKELDASHTAAFGNGNNDVLMLKAVKEAGGLAIAVDNGEGCSVEAMLQANLFIVNIVNALDLLLEPTRLKATLRR